MYLKIIIKIPQQDLAEGLKADGVVTTQYEQFYESDHVIIHRRLATLGYLADSLDRREFGNTDMIGEKNLKEILMSQKSRNKEGWRSKQFNYFDVCWLRKEKNESKIYETTYIFDGSLYLLNEKGKTIDSGHI